MYWRHRWNRKKKKTTTANHVSQCQTLSSKRLLPNTSTLPTTPLKHAIQHQTNKDTRFFPQQHQTKRQPKSCDEMSSYLPTQRLTVQQVSKIHRWFINHEKRSIIQPIRGSIDQSQITPLTPQSTNQTINWSVTFTRSTNQYEIK